MNRKNESGRSDPQDSGEKRELKKDAESCRCKAASKKKIPELFRLMVDDLSFWKKTAKKR